MKKIIKTQAFVTLIVTTSIISGFFVFSIIYHNEKEVQFISWQKSLQDCDIIFQTSGYSESSAIKVATGSKYSHMGMIYFAGTDIYVLEAGQPVRLTPLDTWINRGVDKHFVVKRLTNSDSVLTPETIQRMKQTGIGYLGKNYDIYFEWSDSRIYCSELIWKIYRQCTGIAIGKLGKFRDLNLANKIVQKELDNRFGKEVPLNETIISPISIFNSKKLVKVYER